MFLRLGTVTSGAGRGAASGCASSIGGAASSGNITSAELNIQKTCNIGTHYARNVFLKQDMPFTV
jgi:hypothetical protein